MRAENACSADIVRTTAAVGRQGQTFSPLLCVAFEAPRQGWSFFISFRSNSIPSISGG